jgi:hypothetical protein
LVFLCVTFFNFFLAFQQAEVHKKRDALASSIAFSSLEVLPVINFERIHTSIYQVFYPFMVTNIFTFGWIALLVIFPTKLDSTHLEFGCKTLGIFCTKCSCCFCMAGHTGPRPVWPSIHVPKPEFLAGITRGSPGLTGHNVSRLQRAYFRCTIKGGLPPQNLHGSWARNSSHCLGWKNLLPPSSLLWFLHLFKFFGRGNLDLQLHLINSTSQWDEPMRSRSGIH